MQCPGLGSDGDRGADRVATAFYAFETEGDGRLQVRHNVLQHAQLWAVAILQKYFLTAVMIEVGKGERSGIFDEVEIHGA